jgi:gamma-glutamyltranspeptidase/glutathione hydrolase
VGLRILQEGGHAVDAAVATAAALNVLEPGSTGVGGDMFALVWDNKAKNIIALNGSGRSASSASPGGVTRKGHTSIPLTGSDAGLAVSVPGTVDGWQTLLERSGRMTLKDVLQPAIRYARDGYGVTEVIAEKWNRGASVLQQRPSGDELLLNGRAPKYGEVIRFETLANTLETIAEGGRDAFYTGAIAEKIASFVQENGGWLTEADLAAHHSDWDEPISTEYRGITVHECPPNGQGITALMALNIAEGFDIRAMGPQSADRYHHLIECLRLAFADALQYVADPRVSPVPLAQLLNKGYAGQRRSLISPNVALEHAPHGNPIGGSDTVYLSVIDEEGNACSFINSVFTHFGSGLVVPETGIALHNRGALFSLDPSHPNYLQGSKRPYQTIIPGMATRNGELWLSFGVMGGFQQPQGHLQVISNMVDFGMDPQQALNALRFSVDVEGGGSVSLEEDIPAATVAELQSRGHPITVVGGYGRTMFGGGQIIQRDTDTGAITGGSEPRSDGAAVGW